ncbi:hypothetical protein C8Q79DRAFT_28091 [Trametes meyenii]|nr:hypothetical protein C8Q79DRAFT_28091 [Trametes meyenii]
MENESSKPHAQAQRSEFAESVAHGRVCLSWTQVLGPLGHTFALDFEVDEADAVYAQYQQCLFYLEEHHQDAWLTCSAANNLIRETRTAQFPSSFGILVNLAADRFPFYSTTKSEEPTRLRSDSVIDYMLLGALNLREDGYESPGGCLHALCSLRDAREDNTASTLRQALFLECFTAQWKHESYCRAITTTWSPMPWSRVSMCEASTAPLTEPTSDLPVFSGSGEYADPDHPVVRVLLHCYGCPDHIRWFGAPHDGYAFCPTLGEYIKIRRAGAIQSLRDDAALWVSAMTFGLLEAVTRTRIPEAQFLVSDSMDVQYLYNTHILGFVIQWWSGMFELLRDRDSIDTSLAERGREVAALLYQALRALNEESDPMTEGIFARAGFTDSESMLTISSVALTVIPLCGLVDRLWALPETKYLMDSLANSRQPLHSIVVKACVAKMCRAGWCPNSISYDIMGSSLRYLPSISTVMQIPPYLRTGALDEHRGCSQSMCVFYTISDPATYTPRHTNKSCDCEYTRPPVEDVLQLLQDGLVPAVVYDGKELRGVPANENSYIAISHVWADGMGSTTEEGLPTCVVSRIAGLARTLLPESGAFWLDSLCVPKAVQLRRRAIRLMAQTYRGAAKVLVVDRSLRTRSAANVVELVLFLMSTSGWARRIWTLQEGLLARELWFEFVHGPLDVEKLWVQDDTLELDFTTREDWRPIHDQPGLAPRRSTLPAVLKFRAKLRAKLQATESADEGPSFSIPLGEIIRLLQFRSTTKAEDEILAISTLLPSHVDLDGLLSIRGEDVAQRRMKMFLLQLREVPKHLPMHPSPRLTLPGFSWAARSLTTMRETLLLDSSETGECTENGLFASYLMASFDEPLAITPERRGGRGRDPRQAAYRWKRRWRIDVWLQTGDRWRRSLL